MLATRQFEVDEPSPFARRARFRVRTLAELIDAWRRKNAVLPVAIVASIFDDVLTDVSPVPSDPSGFSLDDVVIGSDGVARLSRTRGFAPDALGAALGQALGDTHSDHHVPSSAQPLLRSLTSTDPFDGPLDAEQARQWIREAIGAPASRSEVAACMAILPSEEPSMPPIAAPAVEEAPVPEPCVDASAVAAFDASLSDPMLPEPADPSEVDTLIPTPVPVLETIEPMEPLAATEIVRADRLSAIEQATRAMIEEDPVRGGARSPPVALRLPTADVPDDRPVIRISNRACAPVCLSSAPAARSSARAMPTGPDSILIPSERRLTWIPWLIGAATIAAFVYFQWIATP